MADSNILASILAGQDPLAPQILQGLQGAQLSATAAANPESTYGPIGVLAKFLGASQGHDMMNNAVQNTTQARIAAQPELARLIANQHPYEELAQNPQGYSPLTRAAFLAGGPRQAQEYQMGQQTITGEALKNLAALSEARLQGAALGGKVPNARDITSGAYQGPDWAKQLGGGGMSQSSAGAVVQPVTETLTKLGYSPIDQAAVLGNAAWESNLNPANTSGDKGTSVGLWQWHSPDRQAGLKQYADASGQNWTDPSVQAGYMDQELRQRAPEFFDPKKTLAEKTKIFQDKFEVPAADTSAQRTRLAQNFTGSQPTTDVGAGAGAATPPSAANMSGQDALALRLRLQAMKMKIPQAADDYLTAQMMPHGPPRDLALAQAMKNGGLDVIQNIRANGTLLGLDPNNPLGPPRVLYHAPGLAEGQTVSQAVPGGPLSAVDVPGAMQGIAGSHAAAALGSGQYKPEIYYDSRGNPVQGTAAQAPQFANPAPGQAPGAAPSQAQPAAPGGLAAGGAIPPPPPQPKQTPYSGAPSFLANTPVGQKDISQVHIGDMFPGGAGIPQPGGPAGPPDEMAKEIQKEDAARLSSYNKEQGANQQINQDLLRLHGVLERGFSTSHIAQIGSDLANIAHGLGADWAYPAGWAPASAAEYNKATTDLVFAALKALPGQPRVTEITGLQKANPNITIPRETNFQMMNDILARSKWQDERARLATEFTVAHKGVPLSVFDSTYNRMAPLPDVANEYMGALRQHGAVFPEDVKAGGGPPAPPARRSRFNPNTGKIEPMQ